MVNLHFVSMASSTTAYSSLTTKSATLGIIPLTSDNFGGHVRFALRSPDPFRQTVLSLATPLSSPVKSCCRAST